MSSSEYDTRLLRERIADNPRPAMLWASVAVFLVMLEFARLLSGIQGVVTIAQYLFGVTAMIPDWIGGNFASVFGSFVGYLVTDVVTFAFLFGFATILSLVLPLSIADRLTPVFEYTGQRETRRRAVYLERLLLTLAIGLVGLVVILVPIGSLSGALYATVVSIPVLGALLDTFLTQLQFVGSNLSITSRELIPNMGHRTPDGGWEGTFLGLSPAWAWAIRVTLVYLYAFICLGWIWKGYNIYRDEYRVADWTPRDDTIKRFLNHYWGMFGFIIVFMFVVMALWAPAVSPVTAQEEIYSPWDEDESSFTYYNPPGDPINESDAIEEVTEQAGEENETVLNGDETGEIGEQEENETAGEDSPILDEDEDDDDIFGDGIGISNGGVDPGIGDDSPDPTDIAEEETGLITITHGQANIYSQSTGGPNFGPFSYDPYDRWAPLGTTSSGHDMLTHLAYGSRTTLVIGLTAITLGGFIALLLSLLTAYYKGLVDMLTVLASDTVISIPALLMVMMLSIILADHSLAEPMDGAVLLGLIFAFAYWPVMWRSIRGPSLQVAEEEWVDAAKSYGQRPLATMRKHMAPYIAGYIMIYASLLLGGIIIFSAALSFLGIGISEPTPEWGRLIADGRGHISTASWHISTVPGIFIVLVVMALNALGDGIRDAIDPQADVGEDAAASAGGG